ncbi:uncharacterized protein NECHADRAFT_44335, partial [Fusarium vanettenii 77-13-4]
SSSLELILKALRSLKKGIKVIIHRVTLLAIKNKDLREVNKILSRRQRAKRT